MGVKHLWSIIQPICNKESLESMRGKVLCVDLSTWICQAEEIIALKNAVAKPYLRNTIFRVICLKRLGTRLIFVTEGKPPEIKWDAILARAEARAEAEKCGVSTSTWQKRNGRYQNRKPAKTAAAVDGKDQKPRKMGRSVFQRKINEAPIITADRMVTGKRKPHGITEYFSNKLHIHKICAQLFKFLGIPVVKSEGEAEACCAFLDKNNVADGVITQDGDTFLYGGEVVYKNLGISNKDPHVYRYSVSDVEKDLGINRAQMVALALLLGCDYCDGVPGVGKKTALRLLEELHDIDILERFRFWKKENKVPESASNIEKQVFRKVMKVANFPNEEVIKEFLDPRDDMEQIKDQIFWDYPDMVNVQRFCAKHMEWPEEYTLSKVLGVATTEHLNRISRGIPLKCPFLADRLIKSRIKHGVPLCEVEWKMKCESGLTEFWRSYPETFITLESQQEILLCLPGLVEEFEKMKLEKKTKGKRTSKKTKSKGNAEINNDNDTPLIDCTRSATNEFCDDQNGSDDVIKIFNNQESNSDRIDFCYRDSDYSSDSSNKSDSSIEDQSDMNYDKEVVITSQNEATACTTKDLVSSFSRIDLNLRKKSLNSTEEIKDILDDLDVKRTSTLGGDVSEILPLRERLQRKALHKAKYFGKDGCSDAVVTSASSQKSFGTEAKKGQPENHTPSNYTFGDPTLPHQKSLVEDAKSLSPSLPHKFDTSLRLHATTTRSINENYESLPYGCKVQCRSPTDAIECCFENDKPKQFCVEDNADNVSSEWSAEVIEYSPLKGSNSSCGQSMQSFDINSPLIVDDASRTECPFGVFTNTPSAPLTSMLTPIGAETLPYEIGNLTNDSFGCLLNETVSLFDSPFNHPEERNCSLDIKTPNGEEYVENLRKKFGIGPLKTPPYSNCVNVDSPQNVEDERVKKVLPLSLMERLKKRSAKT